MTRRADLPPTDPVRRAIHLLEWARREGYRIGPTLVVGDVTMQVEDVRQLVRLKGDDGGPIDDGPYQEAGAGDEPVEGTAG